MGMLSSLLDGWLVESQVRRKAILKISFVDVDFELAVQGQFWATIGCRSRKPWETRPDIAVHHVEVSFCASAGCGTVAHCR